MKVFIWIACLFVPSALAVLLKDAGILLGGIPTAILYGVALWAAKTLTKKWENKHEKLPAETREHRFMYCTIRKRNIVIFMVVVLLIIASLAIALVYSNSSAKDVEQESRQEHESEHTAALSTDKNDVGGESGQGQESEHTSTLPTDKNEAEEESEVSENPEQQFSFKTVQDLLAAIKKSPYKYIDKRVFVKGTLCKCEKSGHLSAILALVDTNEPLPAYNGAELRYQLNINPSINITMVNDVSYTVIEHNDYLRISGIVKISNGEIYLDRCTYKLLQQPEE